MSSDRQLEDRVEKLYGESQKVLDQCVLDSGAIVAAHSGLEVYPATAESYLFFWGRDAAFQLKAQHVLDPDLAVRRAKKLARWLHRIPDFTEEGILVKRYAPNGVLDVRYGEHYQPDQAGALIGTFDEIVPETHKDIDDAIFRMAEGLTEQWNGQSFGPTQDLWENRETSLDDHDVFTYSLASVIHGMHRAIQRVKRTENFDPFAIDHWEKAYGEMNRVYTKVQNDRSQDDQPFLRKVYPDSWHHDPDNTLDASLSGLVYPFANPHQPETNQLAIEKTVLQIHRELYEEGYGVKRYLGDTYDGIVRSHSAEAHAGTWPLLTFWLAIALKNIGKDDEARKVFYDQINTLDTLYREGELPDNQIPEQIYIESGKQGKGVLPLAWSHAMLVLAAHTLEVLR